MRGIIFVLLLLFNLNLVSASVIINEVMYNPSGSDNNKEFVEVYSENILPDLTGWTIADSSSDDDLGLLNNFTNSNFALIVEESFNFSGIEVSVYSVGATIGNNLNNGDDSVYLYYPNSTLVDSFSYTSSMGADGDGNSLQLINGSWQANEPTPGEHNFYVPPPSFILDYPSYVLNDGTVFLIKASISGFTDGEYDIKLDIKDEDENRIARIYDTNDEEWQSTTYYVYNASKVEDGSGDYLAYLKIDPDKNYIGTATIKGRLRKHGSSPYPETVLYAFDVLDSVLPEDPGEEEQNPNSSIQILDVSPSSVNFGDVVKVKMGVYRGDTSKYAVYAYVEDENGKKISEKNSMHFKSKFTNYILTVPIQLKPNCDLKFSNGNHTLVVEGLGEYASSYVQIEGLNDNLCEESASSNATSSVEIQNIYLGSDNKARFGDIVRTKIKVHKGNTTKNMVYLWIEDEKGSKVSEKPSLAIYGKYLDYTTTVPIQTELNCDEDYDDEDYYLVIEAFQAITKKEEIELYGKSKDCPKESSSCPTSSKSTSKSFEYKITDVPLIKLGEEFGTEVELTNNEDDNIDIEIWSYIYRGSKCYSGDREENKQKFILKEGSSKTVRLLNIVKEAEPGDYNLKVKIRKNQQSTLKELTEKVHVTGSYEENIETKEAQTSRSSIQQIPEESILARALLEEKPSYSSVVIYESSSQKAKNLIPIFIIILSVLLNIILMFRR